MINRFRIYGREEKCVDGDLCYFEDVEAILNSAQQLKAEIAAFSDKLLSQECAGMSYSNIEVAQMLLQLSAV